MKAVVARVARPLAARVTVREVDISGNPDLEARYGLEIPVLTIDGKKAAKYRLSEEALARMLQPAGGE
jgi:hypothetical protein